MRKAIATLLMTGAMLGCGVGAPEAGAPNAPPDQASVGQGIEACTPGHGGPATCTPGFEGDLWKCPWPGAWNTVKSCYRDCWDPLVGYYKVREITDYCIGYGPGVPESVSRIVVVE